MPCQSAARLRRDHSNSLLECSKVKEGSFQCLVRVQQI